MGKLIITDSTGQSQDFPLTKERVTIGRHPDNDIPLNDKAVSGHHAVVITILQDSFLEDLDSTNGTQVNGKAIAKHPLSDGDLISIGRNTLKYEGEAAADDDFEKTMILKPGQLGAAFDRHIGAATEAGSIPGSPPPTTARPLLGKLRVTSGPNQGKELELSKALTTIGKPGVQVAAITRRADGYYIVHVGGESGGAKPLHNGAPVESTARKLSDGDSVELVGTQMTFMLLK
ncbi:FHA domain-containing protein [Sinimarinibacterium sp. CAU 1509]|uniref:FHA domain-containing protein n=1 Tax=Sinimarinibacterium sp. CAU 1509 TaxID=2562283 RepID=UPI0010AC5A6C|nr:FHA domain-containing protein [Sinimarinibacterium sp. CAU 1509]TJY62110.1 FHA domain-containing protein [Sinimarinibacterium sp. CAU 1509]